MIDNDRINRFRYSLHISIGNGNDEYLLIMMNPSKADKYQSDRTINKAIETLINEGFNGTLKIVNLYPVYVSKSKELNKELNRVKKKLKSNFRRVKFREMMMC